VGWVGAENISAEQFGENIAGCDTIMKWDLPSQEFIPHPMGTEVNNFDVNTGMGLFIHTDQESLWYGGIK